MKVNLNLAERIALVGILPAQGDILTVRKSVELRDVLVPSDKEVKKHKIVVKVSDEGNVQYKWDISGNKGVDIEIGEWMERVVVRTLKSMNKAKKITPNLMTICEKFSIPEESEEEDDKKED